jgi:hypothetical protein
METKWEVGPVNWVNGKEAFIDAINEGQKDWRYTGRVRNHSGDWIACGWHANGRFMFAEKDHPCNLAPAPKKTVRVHCWLVVDHEGQIRAHETRQGADGWVNPGRTVAVIEIDREVTDGEGL